jgi:hypothetical protein
MNDEARKLAIRVIPFFVLGVFFILFVRLRESLGFSWFLIAIIGSLGIGALEKRYLKFFNAEYEHATSRPLSIWISFCLITGFLLLTAYSLGYINWGGR